MRTSKRWWATMATMAAMGLVLALALSSLACERVRGPGPGGQTTPRLPPDARAPDARAASLAIPGFLLDRLPGGLAGLQLRFLPDHSSIYGGVLHRGRLVVAGEQALHELDPRSGRLLRMSDVRQAECNGDLAVVGDRLFAACRPASEKPDRGGFRPQRLFEIDLERGGVVRVYGPAEGLRSGANFQLAADGATLWIATFDGLARLDTRTGKVSFHTADLGVGGTSFSVSQVLVDRDHVWAALNANVYTQGGLVLFDKRAGAHRAFLPRDLMRTPSRFDLSAWQLVPGGIEIAFRDGAAPDRMAVKRYEHASGTWREVASIPQERSSEWAARHFSAAHAGRVQTLVRKDGLVDLQLPGQRAPLACLGRSPMRVSPVIDGRRYVLTSASLDVVDGTLAFPELLVPLGKSISVYGPVSPDTARLVTDPDTKTAMVFATFACNNEYAACPDDELWLIDLAARKVLLQTRLREGQLKLDQLVEERGLVKTPGGFAIRDGQGRTLRQLKLKLKLPR